VFQAQSGRIRHRKTLTKEEKMKKFLLTAGCVFSALSLSLAGYSIAQQDGDTAGFAYGSVISVSAKSIVISQYDYDAEKEVPATYVINRETIFENVKSHNEIAVNDDVYIEYREDLGQKVAVEIEKEPPVDSPSDDDDEDNGQDEHEGEGREHMMDTEDATRG
jgi:hypothetical protein